jgi:hypothetical protein
MREFYRIIGLSVKNKDLTPISYIGYRNQIAFGVIAERRRMIQWVCHGRGQMKDEVYPLPFLTPVMPVTKKYSGSSNRRQHLEFHRTVL